MDASFDRVMVRLGEELVAGVHRAISDPALRRRVLDEVMGRWACVTDLSLEERSLWDETRKRSRNRTVGRMRR